MPLFFSPPKGAFGLSFTVASLMCVMPACVPRANPKPRFSSRVTTALASPYSVSLASLSACCSPCAVMMVAIGPKVSLRAIAMSFYAGHPQRLQAVDGKDRVITGQSLLERAAVSRVRPDASNAVHGIT